LVFLLFRRIYGEQKKRASEIKTSSYTHLMPHTSAGLLLFRKQDGWIEVLLGHMGGPFWQYRDAGGWTIPKGEYTEPEDPFTAALREFSEEIGSPAPDGKYIDLGTFQQKTGKIVRIWALEADLDITGMHSNLFEMEWPKGSGQRQSFHEVDRAEWFSVEEASKKLVRSQVEFLHRLRRILSRD
jgi:predicted NUDIX family NTP pyrophosphohydrolase